MAVKVPKPNTTTKAIRSSKAEFPKPRKPHTHPVEVASNGHELGNVFDAVRDSIRVINKDFTVCRINKAFAEMAGVDQVAVIGKKCWELFTSPLCHTSECRLQRILGGEKHIEVEIERMRKDGTTIPCEVYASPLLNDDGELIGVIEQFRDITERRRMKDEIKESEDRYRSLIELGTEAGEAIVMLQDIDGKEGIQVYFNTQWQKITGYAKEELLGTSFFDLLHPGDRQASLKRHLQKMSGETVAGLFEMKLIRKDGLETFLELTGAFTTYKGQQANVMFIRDITKRKQIEIQLALSERQYQTLFEDAPISLWEIDDSELKQYVEGLIAKGVKDFREYFYAHPEELWHCMSLQHINKMNKCSELMVETDIARLRTDLEKTNPKDPNELNVEMFADVIDKLVNKKTHMNSEIPFRSGEGHKKWALQKISIVRGYEDTWGKAISAVVDITELKEKEKRLMKAEHQLELLNKKIITAQEEERLNISRELHDQLGQELVAARLAALSLAKESGETHTILNAKELADMLTGTAKSIQRISLELRPPSLDSLGFIRAVNLYIAKFEKESGIHCVLNISATSEEKLNSLGEAAIVSFRIIQEALTNILKHAQATTAEISISIYESRVILKISDNGRGIEKYKVKDNMSIGLVGMRERAKILGGKLSIWSKMNKGTRIIVSLPFPNADTMGRIND